MPRKKAAPSDDASANPSPKSRAKSAKTNDAMLPMDETPLEHPAPTAPALSPAPVSVVSSSDPEVKVPAERVFLIDAMSHVFRAFFAPMGARMEPLTNSHGQVTQAVFIFTNMLRKLLDDEKPHYIAAVFEGGKTFREESFAAYKANRLEAPDDLKTQLPYIKRVCEVFRIPVLNVEGYEADDVIGTLAVQAAAQGLQAVIVSNDKDMCQLVRDPAIICMRNNSQNVKRKEPVPPVEWCDEAWVRTKFDVPPAQIIDLLGLMGDSVDNIPGAPGIGAKGAVAIVKQFGSIENALANASEVKHKTYRESLLNNPDIIRQSKDLATIRTDAPIKLDLDSLRLETPDRAAAYTLFRELEFKSLMREFADSASMPESATNLERSYTQIRMLSDLDALTRRLYDRDNWGFAITGATPPGAGQQEGNRGNATPKGIAISSAPNTASYVDLENFEGGSEQAVAALRDLFDNGLLSKCTHDSKRAVALLETLGISLEGLADDTLLAAYLLDPVRSRYELADLARDATGFEMNDDAPEGWTPEAWRAANVADATAQTADILRGRLAEQGVEAIYTELELPLAPLLHRIERAGLRVDRAVLNDLSGYLGGELEKLTARIYEVAGREFKITSPKQVGEVLEDLNISRGRKTSGGQISTSRAVLDDLAREYELPRLIIEYRELDKLKTVYADALPMQIADDGRIHCQLNQAVTATGRISASDPNLQNIPIRTELGRRIRRAFIPDEGNVLITADYSQLELRLLAYVTRDEVMLDAYQKGDDIHSRTARLVFGAETDAELKEKRRLAKIVNFAIAYAVEPYGLSARTGLSMKEAKQVIADYYDTYKGVRRYMEEVPAKARETGMMRSIYGRLRPLPTINDRNHQIRGRAEREAINMPIQGSASDIVKSAMLKVDDALRSEGLRTRMVMQIHDELLLEAPREEAERAAALLKREMESAVELDVPLEVEVGIGDNWMDAK
jgi:DNA polymerase-1